MEAERRLKENGPNVPLEHTFPKWWHLLWNALFHPFNIILIVLSVLSFITNDIPNGFIMLTLVFISVSLRFYQVISFISFLFFSTYFFTLSFFTLLLIEFFFPMCVCTRLLGVQQLKSSNEALRICEMPYKSSEMCRKSGADRANCSS